MNFISISKNFGSIVQPRFVNLSDTWIQHHILTIKIIAKHLYTCSKGSRIFLKKFLQRAKGKFLPEGSKKNNRFIEQVRIDVVPSYQNRA